MRVYSDERVKAMSHLEKIQALNGVKTNPDLTIEEKEANIQMLESHILGKSVNNQAAIAEDIKAGMADISDITGH